jgi:hypothetical protein
LLGFVPKPTPSQQSFVGTLCALYPEIVFSVELTKQFRRMKQEHDASAWLTWRKVARWPPVHRFVRHLQRDAAAVQNPELAEGLEGTWRREQIAAIVREIFRQ